MTTYLVISHGADGGLLYDSLAAASPEAAEDWIRRHRTVSVLGVLTPEALAQIAMRLAYPIATEVRNDITTEKED